MKTGRNLIELATEVERLAAAKKDYIVPTGLMHMRDDARIEIQGKGDYDVTEHTHNQIGERLDIPSKYYDRMRREEPRLLAQNVNTWFEKKSEKRMVRTMTLERPVMRAFLGDGYRRLDNFELMQAVLPFIMQEYGKPLRIESSEVTETRLHLKVIAPHTERDLNTLLAPGTHKFINEPVQAGFIVQNSEIGMGAIAVFPFVDILRCTNGAMVTEYGQRKYHAGRRAGRGMGDDAAFDADSIMSDQTRMLDDAAFWSKTKDIIRAAISEETVGKIFTKFAEAREMKIIAPPEKVVEVLANNYGLNEKEKSGVLRTLIDSGMGLTKYGVMNALTEIAKDEKGELGLSYDRATELERAGGDIITLGAAEWKQIAEAA